MALGFDDDDDMVGVSEDVATALLDTRVSFLALGFDGDNLVGVDDDVAADLLVPRLHCADSSQPDLPAASVMLPFSNHAFSFHLPLSFSFDSPVFPKHLFVSLALYPFFSAQPSI